MQENDRIGSMDDAPLSRWWLRALIGVFVFGGAVVCLAVWLVTSPARAVKPAKAQA